MFDFLWSKRSETTAQPLRSAARPRSGAKKLSIESLEPRHLMASVSVNAGQVIRTVNDNVLGVNVGYWAGVNDGQTQQWVQAAGLQMYRISNGSLNDQTHFNDPPAYSGANTVPSLASFVDSVGGQAVVTLDYGSGSPQEAAAELAYLNGTVDNTAPIGMGPKWNPTTHSWMLANWRTADYWASLRAMTPLAHDDGLNFMRLGQSAPFGFHYFEVGNEIYGNWETDHHGQGGDRGAPHDPGTYAMFFKRFATLAKQIDPTISIGVDSGAPNDSWTPRVLLACASQQVVPGFISDHIYIQNPGHESDYRLLHAVSSSSGAFSVSARSNAYRQLLQRTFGAAGNRVELLATEFNSVTYNTGKQTTSLVEGLFVADVIGSMLETPYNGAIYWDLRNGYGNTGNHSASLYGWRSGGDYGLIGSYGRAPATGPTVPYPQYFAEQLLSQMVHYGDSVVRATSSDPNLAVYAVHEVSGNLDLLVINKSSSAILTGSFQLTGFQPASTAHVWQYGKAEDTAQSQTTDGHSALTEFMTNLTLSVANFNFTFPAYSMTVLDLSPGASPPTAQQTTVQPTQNTADQIHPPAGDTSTLASILASN
jgi:hypothetical protein